MQPDDPSQFGRRGSGPYFVLENASAAVPRSVPREYGPFAELGPAIAHAVEMLRGDGSRDLSLWIGEGEERTLLMPCADLRRIAESRRVAPRASHKK